ncbi:Kunitz/Bovine pancreatic trypsin inhibitor domain protein, partial [Ostertagia ostertagi]
MSFHEETPITGCSQSTTCSNNYECKSVGSSQWCCPSVASVCGPIGGRPLDTSIYSRGSVYHNGVEKQGTTPSTRFFYDPATGKCSPFTYLGAAGNYNNFLSRIDCELYCARLQCDRGNPLRIGDVTQSCQSNSDCPHLMSAELISQSAVLECRRFATATPLRVGNCDRSVRRYWYSAATRECQSFEYTDLLQTFTSTSNIIRLRVQHKIPSTDLHELLPRAQLCFEKFQQNRDVCRVKPIRTLRESLSRAQPTGLLHPARSTTSATTTAICMDVVPQKRSHAHWRQTRKTCGPGVSFKFYYNAQT